jgi:hypothetical protein
VADEQWLRGENGCWNDRQIEPTEANQRVHHRCQFIMMSGIAVADSGRSVDSWNCRV